MKILINLGGILGHDSQEVYAVSMLASLLPTLQNHTVYVVLPKEFPMAVFKNSNAKVLPVSSLYNKLYSLFFTQCILPLYVLFLKIDVVYSPTIVFPILCAKRSFPTFHDIDYAHPNSSANIMVKKYMQMLYRVAAQKAQKCFAISQTTADEVSKKYGVQRERFVVIHSALPVTVNSVLENMILPATPYLLYVGIYRARKNIELLIRAYAAICREVPDSLVLAGSVTTQQSALMSLARSLHCEDRIIFTGYVSDGDKKKLYEHATAVVLPSLYEGFGFPILEAHANKVPIVLSDISVFHEIAGEAGLFFEARSAASLSENLKKIVSDAALRSSLITKGSENLSRFSWQKTAATIATTIGIL